MPIQSIPELERLLEEAIGCRASDLFLVPGEPPTFRIDGYIQRGEGNVLTEDEIQRIALAAVGQKQIDRIGGENGFAHARIQLSESLFANISVASNNGELTAAARPVSHVHIDVQQLAVPEAIVRAVEAPYGLVMVTGPPYSGKTTTINALLEHLNATRDIHIITAEYYAECILEPKRALVQQRQIGIDAPDMQSAIRSALLQDLDVLFVGEIRDVEVLRMCLTVAELGHLVIAPLHQPTPEAAYRRIIDLQPDDIRKTFRELLAKLLRGVVAQCLLPRADGRGKVPAYGVLIPDDQMREAITEGKDIMDRTQPLPEGCQAISDHIIRLRDDGIVTAEAAERALESIR